MKSAAAALPLLAGLARASPLETRQSCPSVYIFGARETTVSPGFGSAGALVDMVQAAYPDSGSEAIDYPACGGGASCGGVSYDDSMTQGTTAVIEAVTSYNAQCPDSSIVLIGYSQGGQIMDNALCGGLSSTLTGSALAAVKAAVFMGDPNNVAGLPYNVGTCKWISQFSARPSGFQCSPADTSILQSYCDAEDPYCCNGSDANHHQLYVSIYGDQALSFIQGLLG